MKAEQLKDMLRQISHGRCPEDSDRFAEQWERVAAAFERFESMAVPLEALLKPAEKQAEKPKSKKAE